MAKRRMLSIDLCTSDLFLNLSDKARLLYFYLNLHADDDGFTCRARTIARHLDVPEAYLEELCEKNYLIRFDNGVYVITHWCLHNQIKKDRYTPTDFIREFKMLELVNKVYVLKEEKETSERSVFFGDILEPQISLDERSEDKLREEKERKEKKKSDERRSSVCTDVNSSDVENFVENSKSRKKEADKGERQESEKEPCSSNTEKTNEDERTVSEIRLYFMVKNRAKDADGFIEYNERRQWIGRFGESVKENLRRYVNGWIEMGAAFYGE